MQNKNSTVKKEEKRGTYIVDDLQIETNAPNYVVSETVALMKKVGGNAKKVRQTLEVLGYTVYYNTTDIQVYTI